MCAKRLRKNTGCTKFTPMKCARRTEGGDAHIHDLGFFGPYCAGWDLRQLLTDGFGGVYGKVESGRQSIAFLFGTDCKLDVYNAG